MWFFYALVFAIASSISGIISKKIVNNNSEVAFILLSLIFVSPFLLMIILVFFEIPQIDRAFIISMLMSVILDVVAIFLATKALKMSEISFINPISAFNPVFVSIIAFVFLDEILGLTSFMGILFVVAGAYTLQISKSKTGLLEPIKSLFTHKGVQFALAAYFIWSVTPILQKTAIGHTSPNVPPFASFVGLIGSILVYLLIAKVRAVKVLPVLISHLKLFLLLGILGGVAQASAFQAYNFANLGPVVAVFKLSMIFTVLLVWLVFKEKDIKSRLLRSVVMLTGVILLVI